MSETSVRKSSWKLILNVITVGALIVMIYLLRKQIGRTLTDLPHVHAWALLLIIPIEYIDYHAQAKVYQSLLKTLGSEISFKYLFRLSVELNFVNHVFPSGGVSGLSYFGLQLRKEGVRASRSTVAQMMKLVLLFLSFEALLLIGVVALAAKGHVNNFTILVAGSLTTLLIVGTLLFTYVIGSKSRINGMLTAITKAINKVIHTSRLGKKRETLNIDKAKLIFDELHENYLLFKTHVSDLKEPFWWSFVANVMEVTAVYVVYVAFGHLVNYGAVVLAYAIANFAGLISVTPGGVGVYEALMTAVMISTGVPPELSIPVTIMYRVVSIAVQVPPGFWLYHRRISGEANAA